MYKINAFATPGTPKPGKNGFAAVGSQKLRKNNAKVLFQQRVDDLRTVKVISRRRRKEFFLQLFEHQNLATFC